MSILNHTIISIRKSPLIGYKVEKLRNLSMATTFAWQEDDVSKFMDYKVAAEDGGNDRIVRLRVSPADADVGARAISPICSPIYATL